MKHKTTSIHWMIVICALLTAGCTEKAAETDQPNKKYQLADEHNPSTAIADSIKESVPSLTNPSSSTTLPDSVDELIRFLAQKQVEQRRTADKRLQYTIQTDRERAATKLLNMDLDAPERFQAVRAKLDAQLRLMVLGDTEANGRLREFASEFVDDPQQNVAEGANVALLASDMSNRFKDPSSNLQPVVEQAKRVVNRFPNSYEVCKEIYGLTEGMLRVKRRDEAIQLMRVLEDRYAMNKDKKIAALVQTISNRIRLAALEFDLIMNDLREKTPGAIEKYQAAITALVSSSNINTQILQEITKSLQWLEANQLYVEALQANQVVLAAADDITDVSLKNAIRRQCILRSRRIGMLNKPMKFQTSTAAGNELDWDRFQNKVVLVLFWATSEPSSIQLLRQFAGLYEAKKNAGLEYLAINLTPDLNPMNTLFGNTFPEWQIAVNDQPAKITSFNLLADRFGIIGAPYFVLVDRKGDVVYVSGNVVDLNDLKQRIDKLLNNQ